MKHTPLDEHGEYTGFRHEDEGDRWRDEGNTGESTQEINKGYYS